MTTTGKIKKQRLADHVRLRRSALRGRVMGRCFLDASLEAGLEGDVHMFGRSLVLDVHAEPLLRSLTRTLYNLGGGLSSI